MPLSSSTSKTKKTSKCKTPSFVCEIPLQVTRHQERILETRFEAGRQLYNALLGEATKRLALVRQSIWFALAKKSTDKKERQAHFAAARQAHGFSAYALEAVLRELYRRETAHRKTLHGQLANQVIAIGTQINTEKLSYKALQKMYGRSIGVRAPKLFLTILNKVQHSQHRFGFLIVMPSTGLKNKGRTHY